MVFSHHGKDSGLYNPSLLVLAAHHTLKSLRRYRSALEYRQRPRVECGWKMSSSHITGAF